MQPPSPLQPVSGSGLGPSGACGICLLESLHARLERVEPSVRRIEPPVGSRTERAIIARRSSHCERKDCYPHAVRCESRLQVDAGVKVSLSLYRWRYPACRLRMRMTSRDAPSA